MKIELSIDKDYCSDWSLYSGVREFAQNGRDAMQLGHSFDMIYVPGKSILRVLTKGTTLGHDSLLLGNSSKRDTPGMIGKWGEGFKIGSLALLRLGKKIRIRTGSELWQPIISMSKSFKAEVLMFEITGGKTDRNEIDVEIHGITPEEWEDLSWRFLFLSDHSFTIKDTTIGSVLIDGAGKIFVGGIYVCDNKDFVHGYDLLPNGVSLDRDRRIVDSWDAQLQSARIWEQLYIKDMFTNLVDSMLADDKADVKSFKHSWVIGEATRKKISDQFIKKHGENAIAVRALEEINVLKFYGKAGQIVNSESLRSILESSIGSTDTVKAGGRDTIKERHQVSSLSDAATKNLLSAIKMVTEATGSMIPYEIVTFVDPQIAGMHRSGMMSISIGVLDSLAETLKTVVEEVAHLKGADGTREFQEELHNIYATMILISIGEPKSPARVVAASPPKTVDKSSILDYL